VHTPIVMNKLERIEKVFYFSSKTEKSTFSRSSSKQTNKQGEGAVDPPLLWSFTLCFLNKEVQIFTIYDPPAQPKRQKTRGQDTDLFFMTNDITPRKESRHKSRRRSRQHPNQFVQFQSAYPVRGLHNARFAFVEDQARSEPKATKEKC